MNTQSKTMNLSSQKNLWQELPSSSQAKIQGGAVDTYLKLEGIRGEAASGGSLLRIPVKIDHDIQRLTEPKLGHISCVISIYK